MIVKWQNCYKNDANGKKRRKMQNKIFIFNAWVEFCDQYMSIWIRALKKKIRFLFNFVPLRNHKRKFRFGFDIMHKLLRLRCLYSLYMFWSLSHYVCHPVSSVLCTHCAHVWWVVLGANAFYPANPLTGTTDEKSSSGYCNRERVLACVHWSVVGFSIIIVHSVSFFN